MGKIADQIAANLRTAINGPPAPQPFAKPILRNIADYGTGQQTVGVVPVQIVGPRFDRRGIKITNLSAVQVFIGNSATVSINNGDQLSAGVGQWLAMDTRSAVYGVVAVGTALVSWTDTYE